MNKILTNTFENTQIRVVMINNEPWFIAKDVFKVLGKSSKSGKDFEGLDEDERGVFKIHTSGGMQETTIVSESGLYFLVLKSRKPIAKPFQKWVTKEVLPQIRKTGSYSLQDEVSEIELSEILSETQTALEIVDLIEKEKPFKLLLLEKILKEKSPTKILGIDFSKSYFLPTELGILIGVSGAEMNLILMKKSFQFRDENGVWRPTSSGKEFCLEIGNQFNQIKWKLEVFALDIIF
ncbi:prophage antirepressor [Thiovulum sp. ES]|nr:prophage antirepressor [Thiovulum sp. ES]